MVGNPVLGFLEAQPVGDDARSTVTKMLRWLGIAVLAGFAVSLVSMVLVLTMGDAYTGTGTGALVASTAIVATVIGLVITGLVCWWLTYTIRAWSSGQANGGTHALIIGIIATVFGGIGALMLLGIAGANEPARMGIGVLQGLVALAELACGILILVNRGKALNPGTAGTPARN